jgi:DNA-binding NarL/FixJ family response regulator
VRSLLLVEDDPRFASSVAAALRTTGRESAQVTIAGGVAEALSLVGKQRFDLSLVDLGLPDGSGTELIARLARAVPPVPALAFTVFDDREQVMATIRAGAVGYLLKEEPVERVFSLIEECLDGNTPVSSRVARYLFDLCRPLEPSSTLTAREADVLDYVARGLTYAECATALGLSLGTVQTHIKAIYRKLDVSSKAEAAAWVTRQRSSS